MRFFRKRQNTIALSEEQFYERMFIKNSAWNKPVPNREESLRWNIIEEFISHILSHKAADKIEHKLNILDLGCGRGWLSNLLSSYGKVTGIEPVKAVAEYGKKLFPQLNLQAGTAEDLISNGFSKSFDVVVCSEVIEHIADDKKQEFAQAIQTLLQPDGFLIITTPRKEMQAEWLKYTQPGQPIEDWMEEAQLKRLFEVQSFKKISLERFSIKPSATAPAISIYQLWLFQKYA